MERLVNEIFDGFIKSKFAEKPNIMNFLLTYERKPECIKKLCEQIRLTELSNFGRKFDAQHFRYVVTEMARLFCETVLEYQEQQIMSHAERQRRIDENNRLDNLEEEWEADQKEFLDDKKVVSYPGV